MVASRERVSAVGHNLSDNFGRWDGRTPHYEVWFATLNHRASQRGFWFRYTLEAPESSRVGLQPVAALWAAAFRRVEPDRNFGIRNQYGADELVFDQSEGFALKLGPGALSSNHAAGRVHNRVHSIEWDLRFEPCPTTYHHVSPALVRLLRPSSFVCSPNLDTRFTGRISVDEEEVIIDSEPGCQSHLWGRKRVDDWVWVHSNAFEKHPGTVFEGLAARPRRAGRTLPPIQSLFLRHRGEEHRFTRLRLAEQWRLKLGMGYWSFSAMNTDVYVEGAAQCRLRDMLQAEYTDPDGERLYCVNSEVANLRIRLFKRTHGLRWRHVETIKAYATAHLEHAGRTADSRVQTAFDQQ